MNDALAAATIARDELRKALAARSDGNRVTYNARKADTIVIALRALDPETTVAAFEDAIRRLRQLFTHDLPQAVARHIRSAIRHADQALRIRQPALI